MHHRLHPGVFFLGWNESDVYIGIRIQFSSSIAACGHDGKAGMVGTRSFEVGRAAGDIVNIPQEVIDKGGVCFKKIPAGRGPCHPMKQLRPSLAELSAEKFDFFLHRSGA
jgi:hypothetical protein